MKFLLWRTETSARSPWRQWRLDKSQKREKTPNKIQEVAIGSWNVNWQECEGQEEATQLAVSLREFNLTFCLFPSPPGPSEEESEESSSGEVEIEQEVSSDPEDLRELHPGALLHRSSRLHNLPLMAEALAHGADVHAASEEEEGKTPLIQAVMGVSDCHPALD